ncbi:MAG: MFS transporter, partial [Actinophytocola sp.]|nr:MFS transporter [Actinophytocola sp.]
DDAFLAWGWRVPFLLSIVLVGVGVFVRISISESPVFEEVKREKSTAKAPIMVVLRSYPKETLLVAGCSIAFGVAFYLMAVFGVSYGTGQLGKTNSEMLTIILVAMAFTTVGVVFFGWLSDRVGRRIIFLTGSIGMALLAFPWIWLISSQSFAATLAGYLLLCLPYSAAWGTAGVFFAERFETRARYSGVSVGFTIGNIAGSAVAPMIATSLFSAFQTASAVGWYLVAMAAISVISAILLIETQPTRETTASEPAAVQ